MILRGIFHVVSCFPLHFMLYRGNLDYFSDSVYRDTGSGFVEGQKDQAKYREISMMNFHRWDRSCNKTVNTSWNLQMVLYKEF